jgi:hypothetical protein
MLLELAPAAGERSYNWEQKITLAMSATELGTIFAEPHKVPGGGGWGLREVGGQVHQ